MANHKSSQKRIRQTEAHRLQNRYYHKTTRNAVKALRNTTDKAAADKLAKRNVIHANKAGNLKSSIQKHVNAL